MKYSHMPLKIKKESCNAGFLFLIEMQPICNNYAIFFNYLCIRKKCVG